ncbi:MAG: hypothetical protein COZ17_13945 [Flavobacteriaceae bacterium CG_4_10_14_3_um_filter_33_47]|nr:hypothetical protein [Flavobacteriia bacterium]NCP07198.1 hypothetical protein [Flavobacteriales bacterium]NCQ15941.1 hypothetical protein [Flavobacteriales bacterium]PIV94316.1 MAG: hypothetical protein COW44_04865 [Flavobacteriaceae bacterium CG17_big_fil_post_rev_8_21_14_2_50_33_15]PIY09182.1 MAG: hypothetical protein COZ17_13945 [Flavobacteriaceae bacterium CG_4_10_14_3_um_filter_33_47]
MKKQNLLLAIIIGFLSLACSSDNNDEPQLSIKDLLTQGSPWTFNHYEMINIIDAGSSNFTQTDIQNDVNSRENGTVITFNQNGTGSVFIPNEGTDNWDWEIINGNQLKLTFDGINSDILENLNVSSNQLIIETESVSYDEDVQYEVLHNGKYYYE